VLPARAPRDAVHGRLADHPAHPKEAPTRTWSARLVSPGDIPIRPRGENFNSTSRAGTSTPTAPYRVLLAMIWFTSTLLAVVIFRTSRWRCIGFSDRQTFIASTIRYSCSVAYFVLSHHGFSTACFGASGPL